MTFGDDILLWCSATRVLIQFREASCANRGPAHRHAAVETGRPVPVYCLSWRSSAAARVHRGPGELLGRKQSGQAGLGCLRAARLPGDTPLLEAARSSAKAQLTALGEAQSLR